MTINPGQKPRCRRQGTEGADDPLQLGDFQAPRLILSLDRAVRSDPSLLHDAAAEIIAAIDGIACWDEVESIGLAVREALANAMMHGNHCDPEKNVGVSIAVNADCDLLIIVKDSGPGFDISQLAEPIPAENVLVHQVGGIFLMKQLMDQVEFKFDHGTEVRMRLRRQWLE
jgi:anti-sigma regulatory factor (Ser/Thr protein kinase)